jgi:hypothetical protein
MAIALAAGAAFVSGGGSALLGFALNTGANIAFNMLSSAISPKKARAVAEDTPSLGAGIQLYGCWGETFCPTSLLYAVPADRAGHDNEKSTFGVLGCANPDINFKTIAFRCNNFVPATITPLIPLNIPERALNQSTQLSPGGLTFYGNWGGFFFQEGTPVINPYFNTLGFPSLRYEGLSWIGFVGTKRDLSGGFNSRVTQYVRNRITTTTATPFDVTFDNLVTIKTHVGIFGKFLGIGGYGYDLTFTFPHGFSGAQQLVTQETVKKESLVGRSGIEMYVLKIDADVVDDLDFQSVGSIIPGGTVQPGTPIAVAIDPPSGIYLNPTTEILYGADGGRIEKQTLLTPAQPPLLSQAGIIYDAFLAPIATIPAGSVLYGWDNTVFREPVHNFFPVASNWNGTSPISGGYSVSNSDLETVLRDLYQNRYANRTVIYQATAATVRGFTSTFDNIGQTITDLVTAFGKIVYENENGDLVVRDYPAIPSNPKTFTLPQFLDNASLEFMPAEGQPNLLDFLFRSYGQEFAEKSVRVGVGNSDREITSTRLNIVATYPEARKMAWNTYFLTSQTNISAKLQIADLEGIQKGDVVRVEMRNSEDSNVPHYWIVAEIEVGADRTFILTCFNWLPLADLVDQASANPYSEYMLGGLSEVDPTNLGQPEFSTLLPQPILAEPTTLNVAGLSDWTGGLLHTDENLSYASGAGAVVSVPTFMKPSTVATFRGVVKTIKWVHGDPKYGLEELTVERYPGTTGLLPNTPTLLRIGTSWVKGTPVGSNGAYTLSNTSLVELGLFGSEPIIYAGETCYFLDSSQLVTGVVQYAFQTTIPSVLINGTTTYATEWDYNSPATPHLSVNSRFPYGTPIAGTVIATLTSNYSAGTLTVIWGQPGNFNPTDPLWDNSYPGSFNFPREYFVSINFGAFVSLGTISTLSSVTTHQINIPAGSTYRIVCRDSIAVNASCGSYVYAAVSRG